MLNQQPTKTFRGTWDQVISHKDEIPPDATLELKVFEPQTEAVDEADDFGGKSAADVIREIGTVSGLPHDLSTTSNIMSNDKVLGC